MEPVIRTIEHALVSLFHSIVIHFSFKEKEFDHFFCSVLGEIVQGYAKANHIQMIDTTTETQHDRVHIEYTSE